MSEGFVLLDSQFHVIDINREATRYETRTRDELLGRSYWDLYPQARDSKIGQGLRRAFTTRSPVTETFSHSLPGGERLWWEMRVEPTDQGGLATFFRDITKQRQAVRQLDESEARFRRLTEVIGEVFYIFDIEDNRLSYVSPAYERIWRRKVDDLLANPEAFLASIHPDDRHVVFAAQERQRAGLDSDVRYRLSFADGSTVHIHDRAFVTTDARTGTRQVYGLAEDVTASTMTRLQLVRNAETFEALVRNNPFGIYIVDSAFRVINISRGAERVFAGIEPLLGRDLAEVLHIIWDDPFASEAVGHFRNTLATGDPYVSQAIDEQRKNIDGQESYDWRIERIELPSGELGVVCYFYDLSERVALEAQLSRALADKDLLVREVDHRVRNSLSMVSAFLAMQGINSTSPEVKEALANAGARLQAIARVHERIYKSETIGVVEFGDYLKDICADLHKMMQDERVEIAVETVPLDIAVDKAVSLALIANELVTNAFKHCNDCTAIEVRMTVEDGILELTVYNDGPGMPADFKPSVRKGLGMAVVASLTRQLKGVFVTPRSGEESQFTVRIPV